MQQVLHLRVHQRQLHPFLNMTDETLTPEARTALMQKGRAAFNQGQFYEAHEFWEDVWNVIDDPDRIWVQGLIQVATGLHKLAAGREDVAITLFVKALAKLDGPPPVPDALDGVDAGAARAGARRLLDEIRRRQHCDPRSILV